MFVPVSTPDSLQYEELAYTIRTYQPKTSRILVVPENKYGHV